MAPSKSGDLATLTVFCHEDAKTRSGIVLRGCWKHRFMFMPFHQVMLRVFVPLWPMVQGVGLRTGKKSGCAKEQ